MSLINCVGCLEPIRRLRYYSFQYDCFFLGGISPAGRGIYPSAGGRNLDFGRCSIPTVGLYGELVESLSPINRTSSTSMELPPPPSAARRRLHRRPPPPSAASIVANRRRCCQGCSPPASAAAVPTAAAVDTPPPSPSTAVAIVANRRCRHSPRGKCTGRISSIFPFTEWFVQRPTLTR